MNVGIVGTGGHAEARVRAVRAVPGVVAVRICGPGLPEEALEGLDVLFVAVPTAEHFVVAEAAAKRGVHLFLEWPPATSIRESEALVRLAEEAGIEAGVSRPWRFHPAWAALPKPARARLLLLRTEVPGGRHAPGTRLLADAVDLCCALARSHSIQRIDAEAARGEGAWPEAVAAGLRFHSGTYAQISLRYGTARPASVLYVAGVGFRQEVDLAAEVDPAALLEAESRAFLQAVRDHRPAPVSVLDGLHTMRIVERLRSRLR